MRILIAALATACLVGPASAASTDYFFEGVLSGGTGNVDAGDVDNDFTQKSVDITLNLGSVSTYDIPYNEAQFLNQSSFIGFNQTNTGMTGWDGERIERQVAARYVLGGSGLYSTVIADLDPEEADRNVYEIKIGKFTDQFTAMDVGYIIDNQDELEIFTLAMHYTSPYGGDNAWIAYDFTARYLTEADENEYAIGLGAAYYPSFRSAIGGYYEFTDGRLTDANESNLYGEFYFGRRLSTRIDARQLSIGNVKEHSAGLSLKLRF